MGTMATTHWLIKSEPSVYSIEDLERDGTTEWSGVRNYKARSYMRDEMRPGHGLLFYHSSTDVLGVYGTAEVASEAHPDSTQFVKAITTSIPTRIRTILAGGAWTSGTWRHFRRRSPVTR